MPYIRKAQRLLRRKKSFSSGCQNLVDSLNNLIPDKALQATIGKIQNHAASTMVFQNGLLSQRTVWSLYAKKEDQNKVKGVIGNTSIAQYIVEQDLTALSHRLGKVVYLNPGNVFTDRDGNNEAVLLEEAIHNLTGLADGVLAWEILRDRLAQARRRRARTANTWAGGSSSTLHRPAPEAGFGQAATPVV